MIFADIRKRPEREVWLSSEPYRFDEAHRAWLRFRECYARFISQSYSTGSIRPLIHAVTLESITAAWTTELETQLGDESLGED